MQDFSMAKIQHMIIHLVGNKAKEEEIRLSSELCKNIDETTEQHLKQFFFSSFKFDMIYCFFHETDVCLNEIYNYVRKIFDDEKQFIQQSINIAKHLYEVSAHPNIKGGELYVTYIKNCIIDGQISDAIGIFKSETKDIYLEIEKNKTAFDVNCKKGINAKKLDKGCLILRDEENDILKVYMVDTNHNDTFYWKTQFLGIKESNNEYSSTSHLLKTYKQYIKKSCNIEPSKKVSMLNNSVQYFETHDEFELDEFADTVFENTAQSEMFKEYIQNKQEEKVKEKFVISSKAVSNVKRTIKNFIKLDSQIEIKIDTNMQEIDSLLEKGYDDKKKMNYYKIYYFKEE